MPWSLDAMSIKEQVKVVASPRNHLNLLYRRVALIERPVFVCGHGEDAGEVAEQVDVELAFAVRRQFDPLDERADDVGGFGAVRIVIQDGGEPCDLLPVMIGHVRVQEHLLFLRAIQHGFQFVAAGGNAGLGEPDQLRLGRIQAGVLFAAQRVQVVRVRQGHQ